MKKRYEEHEFYSNEETAISIGSSLLQFEDKIYNTGQLVSFEVAKEPFKPPTTLLVIFFVLMFVGVFNDIRDLAILRLIFIFLSICHVISGYIKGCSGLTISFSSHEQEFIAEDSKEIAKIIEALKNPIKFKS